MSGKYYRKLEAIRRLANDPNAPESELAQKYLKKLQEKWGIELKDQHPIQRYWFSYNRAWYKSLLFSVVEFVLQDWPMYYRDGKRLGFDFTEAQYQEVSYLLSVHRPALKAFYEAEKAILEKEIASLLKLRKKLGQRSAWAYCFRNEIRIHIKPNEDVEYEEVDFSDMGEPTAADRHFSDMYGRVAVTNSGRDQLLGGHLTLED